MAYLLALDQGTTSSRAIVFDQDGRVRAIAQQEITQFYPQPGWVEHDAEEIWRSQLAVAREALALAGADARELAAIGIANQRETTLLWERASGRPLHRAIVWQDRRTSALCDALKAEGLEPGFRQRTGLLLDPYFAGTKLAWLLDHIPDARARAEAGELAFGTIDSWLLWKLTGGAVHATDVTNASRTLLFDIHQGDWSEASLRQLDIPRPLLPAVAPSASVFGASDPRWFGAPVVIGGIAGDQQAALFGQACHRPGMVKNTYGTGCFLLMHTGGDPHVSQNGLLITAAASGAGARQYAIEGSIFVAGAAVQWLRDGLGIIRASNEVETLAASVPDSAGVMLVPAFTGLGSPYWDPHARGALLGLTRGSNRAHIARATLESIAYQSADLASAMQHDTGLAMTELRVDGGASVNNLLLQFQADLLGVPVVRPQVSETTALGAAYLAGLSAGLWRDHEAIAARWRAERVFEPGISRDLAEQRMHDWRRAVARVRSTRDDDGDHRS